MRLFRYGFCLGCGLIVAVLVALIAAQFFIRIKVQQIDYRQRPSITPVHWQ